MSTALPNSPSARSRSFQKIVDVFLVDDGLPFAEVLSAERIQWIFQKHGCLFGAGIIQPERIKAIPIRDIQVGIRVPAHNPEMSDGDREAAELNVDAKSWLLD